jgi:2-polyprenyl-6-methoxyphenol hydroxylase-like FAD-dependent oxidoreductase
LEEINTAFQVNTQSNTCPLPPVCIQELTRGAFPLKRLHVTNYVKPRVTLIGDAAHTTHPLAGQGVNMGLVDVHVLAREIQFALESGQDIGSQTILDRYGKPQFIKNEIALNVFEGLKQIYSWNFGPIPFLRSIGVSLVDRITPLKQFIINEATGRNI